MTIAYETLKAWAVEISARTPSASFTERLQALRDRAVAEGHLDVEQDAMRDGVHKRAAGNRVRVEADR